MVDPSLPAVFNHLCLHGAGLPHKSSLTVFHQLRRGDPVMEDLEIMEMFLLEPRGGGAQVTCRAADCTEQCSSQVHDGKQVFEEDAAASPRP